VIYLDTHTVFWLYQKDRDRFTANGHALIDSEELLISPIVELELDYLRAQIGLKGPETSFIDIIRQAAAMKWTRDPFDRIVTATAALQDLPLMTKDRTIHTHYPKAVW
jgi:PIN domain nuclease of toxin-antitoxin system